jgi:hypothetical protein
MSWLYPVAVFTKPNLVHNSSLPLFLEKMIIYPKSPDMQILDCATYFKQLLEVRGGGVTLLTNDKALSLEAEIEG